MKKILLTFTLLLSVCLTLVACGESTSGPTTYRITFDSDGGSKVEAIIAEAGVQIAAPTDPTKEGYDFDGWYLNDVLYEFSIMPNLNITLVAKWTEAIPEPVQYTITFDEAGGSEVADITDVAGATIVLPTPTKEGYNFAGWLLGGTAYNATTMPAENIALVASWEEIIIVPTTYTIAFDEAGGSEVADITDVAGATIVLPTPTKEGYNFTGWLLNGSLYNDTVMPDANITLVASWEEIEVATIDITYVLNGGQLAYANYAAMVADFAADFSAFSGRSVAEDGSNFFDISYMTDGTSAGYNFLTSAEYGAKWNFLLVVINEARVARGASALASTDGQAEARGEIHNLLNLLSPEDGKTAGYGSDYSTYAAYAKIEAAICGAQAVKSYVEVETLAEAYRLGYELEGWYSDEALTTKVTEVTESTTLYAKWNKVYNVLTYVLNNENATMTALSAQIHVSEAFDLVLPAYDDSEYIFNGWFKDEALTQVITKVEEFTAEDITVYGSWTEIGEDAIEVTYKLNGGQVAYTNYAAMVADFAIDFSAFSGRSVAEDGSNFFDISYMADASSAGYNFLTSAEYGAKWNFLLVVINEARVERGASALASTDGQAEARGEIHNLLNLLSPEDGKTAGYGSDYSTYAAYAKIEAAISGGQKVELLDTQGTLLTNVYKLGYELEGWYSDETLTTKVTEVTESTTLYAKWNKVYNILTYVLNNENATMTALSAQIHVSESFDLVLPAYDDTKFRFNGWYLDEELTQSITKIDLFTIEDITVYGSWTELSEDIIEITYVLNGGNAKYETHADMAADFLADFNATTGKSVTDTTALYDAGNVYHTFFNNSAMKAKWGWILEFLLEVATELDLHADTINEYNTFIAGNGTSALHWGIRQNVEGLMSLSRCAQYAGSGAIDFRIYDINSRIEGAIDGGIVKNTVNDGSSLLQDVYRFGYELEGWYSDEALTNKVTNVTASTTLYAKWNKVYNTITYVLNNEQATIPSETVQYHVSDAFALVTPTYDSANWIFNGWYLDEACTTPITSIAHRTDEDITVYGSWTKLSGYTITYNMNGGNWDYDSKDAVVADFLNDYNETRGKSHTVATFAELGSWAEISDASLFLYAKIDKWGWLVDYIASIAGSANKKAYQVFKDYTSQSELHAANGNYIYSIAYELRGFVGGIKYDKNSNYITADYTDADIASAFWSFLNDVVENISINNTGTVTLPTPYKQYYSFGGWYLTEDLSGDPVTSVSGETTLYAKWNEGVAVESVTITNKVSEIERFDSLQLEWTINPSNASIDTVKFTSSDESVATISNSGLITTHNDGTVTISVISQAKGNKTDSFTLTVYSPGHFDASYETESYVAIGEEIKLLAEYTTKEDESKTIVWESLNSSIATVNSGVVTGVAAGVATIRAKVSDTIYFDFTVTVLPATVSAALQHAIDSHESNVFTKYNLGIGAGTPAYYKDIFGSISKLLMNYNYTVNDTLKNKEVEAGTADYYTMGTIEFITVHYTGNMSKGADAEANANYFVGDNSVSIHYTTGNDGIYQALTHDKGAFHAGSGSTTVGWNATGVQYSESDPKWPVWGISSNAKFTINGKETTITVPYKEQHGNEGYVTDSKWLNDQGFGFKIVNGEYYMNNVRWEYSQVYEGRICNNGGNMNSIGIESCVDLGSDLWYTWQITAQHVAHLLIQTNLDITRVVGHHFFSAKDCPQPLLENDLEIWWEFIDLVEAEYELLTTYKDVDFEFALDGTYDFVDEHGRITEQPEYTSVVKYTVTVGGESITLASIVEGIYNK